MASGTHPWSGCKSFGDLMKKMEKKELPKIPRDLSDKCKGFIRRCLIYDKENRPSAKELL